MPYDGYLEVGGREIVNAARTYHYVSTMAPAFGLKDCQDCGNLAEALGQTYTTPEEDRAPWYDPSDPATGTFYGMYPLAIEGMTSSTRQSINVELVGDGSVQTTHRRAGRDLMVRGLMFGETREALDKGYSWLDNTLNSKGCSGEQGRVFSSCPGEVQEYPPSAFHMNVPLDHSWSTDAPLWSVSSGSATGGASLELDFDDGDALGAGWRDITGLIPGQQYQLRLRMNGFSARVRIGGRNVAPDINMARNPHWSGAVFDGTIVTPAPPENMFEEVDGGPLGRGWTKYVYPQDTAADTISIVNDTDADERAPIFEGAEVTVSSYAYAGTETDVTLIVRFFDSFGAQVGSDITADSGTSDGDWVQLSGLVEAPANSASMQIQMDYETAGAITSGTEFGVWGALISPAGTTDYFDGDTDGYLWTGTPGQSSSETDVDAEAVTYFDPNEFWSPPMATTVLDFVPRSSTVTLYIDTGIRGDGITIHEMEVWRQEEPGVVAFSTNEEDMVPVSDGWTIDPIDGPTPTTGPEISLSVEAIHNASYSGWMEAVILARSSAGTVLPEGTGPYRASFGLVPGERYRIAVGYRATWQETSSDPDLALGMEPSIDGAIAQTVVYSEDSVDNEGMHLRVIEFIPGGSTVTVLLGSTEEVTLGEQGSARIVIQEVLLERVFEEADTSPPDPISAVNRTLYGVAAISGPEMTQVRRTSCGWMALVTFGLRAGKPGIFRDPVLVGGLPTSVSSTINAIPCVNGVQPRLNFMYNPSAEMGLESVPGLLGYTGNGNETRQSGPVPGPVVGEWFVQGAGSTDLGAYYLADELDSGPTPGGGATYTHSVYVSADASGDYEWVFSRNYEGILELEDGIVTLVAGEWTRVVNTFTVPVGNEILQAEFHLYDINNLSGNLWMDGFMLEPGLFATDPWDETSEGASWTGVPGASALVITEPVEDITEDPDCPAVPLPPSPPVVDVSCVDQPGTYERSIITISQNAVPVNLTAFPILTLRSGSQDVRQARIRFWENPDRLPAWELNPCGFDGDIIVSFLPAGATLVIDGVQRIATMTLNGVSQDATHLLYGGDGGPVDWPELTGGVEYQVALDLDSDGTSSDTRMDVELVVMD